jgi:hypothetical protein
MVLGSLPKVSPLQDEGTFLMVRDFHHEDVASMSNLGMTMEVIPHSIVQLEAHKKWSCAMP